MMVPVRCSFCGQLYDLANGHPVARYADCTVFTTPCCGRQTDDRPWSSGFRRLTPPEARAVREGKPMIDVDDRGNVSVWHV